MKAVICSRYGSSDVLSLAEVAAPEPGLNEVRVRVKAAAVNDWDWTLMRGKPRPYRLIFGLLGPRWRILGAEVAGVVESVGPEVTALKMGDRVYGDISDAGFGGFAESVCVPETALRLIPDALSFEQAVALPHAAGLAWQALVEVGRIEHGETVLINGVGGGVGVLAVQIARHRYGCTVTGVDKAFKLEALHWLGLAEALDYERVDFTAAGQRYDLIVDAQTTRSPWRLLRALKPGGRYVTVGGRLGRLIQLMTLGPLLGRLTGRRFEMVVLKPNQGLAEVEQAVLDQEVQPLLDKVYPLAELGDAINRFGQSAHVGKVIVMPDDGRSDPG